MFSGMLSAEILLIREWLGNVEGQVEGHVRLRVRLRVCEFIVLSGWMPTLFAADIFVKMQTLLLIGNLRSHDTVM